MAKRKREATPGEIIRSFGDDERALACLLRDDPIAFARYVCGFTPHKKQAEFLRLAIEDNYHVMLPWGRQFGKSLVTAIFIAHRLYSKKGFRAYLFSPSEDQTRQIFNDICRFFRSSDFLRRYMPVQITGDTVTVGGEKWGAFCELVKIGHEGRLGRGRSTRGNGVIVYDEFAVLGSADIVKGNLTPIVASGGGEIILSSPGDPGSTLHQLYGYWKTAGQTNPRYRVIECEWSDTHLTQQWVDDQRAEYAARGVEWQFEREVLGRWVAPSNTWFPWDDLRRCILPTVPTYSPRDQFIWGMDLGGRGRSAFVVTVARYNPTLQRLEVVDLLEFYLAKDETTGERYYRNTTGAHVIHGRDKWGQIEDAILDLRDRYPPTWIGVDPATENSFTGRLANVYRMPISEILIGGYQKKLAVYTALQAGIRAEKVVWHHNAVTEQMKSFCPRRRDNGEWEFPKADTDIVVTLANIYQFLGQQEIKPWAVMSGGACTW